MYYKYNMFYYMYEIKNIINGKIYVGIHKTKNINDGYMGSGKIIKRAIKKYGIENFTKSILGIFETHEEASQREKEVVNEEFLSRDDVYNLRRGGTGGFDYINKHGLNYKGYKSAAERNKTITPMNDKRGVEIRRLAKIGRDKLYPDFSAFMKKMHKEGKSFPPTPHVPGTFKHSEDSKRKIGKANSPKQKGKNNSQFGTSWIKNDSLQINAKITKTKKIPQGWVKGRNMQYKTIRLEEA